MRCNNRQRFCFAEHFKLFSNIVLLIRSAVFLSNDDVVILIFMTQDVFECALTMLLFLQCLRYHTISSATIRW